jgi:hypothetical protein
MKKLILFLLVISSFKPLLSQEYIYLDREDIRKTLRLNIGATQFSLTPKDSAAITANGIHLSNEVKIVSRFWKKDWAFTVHDAFYLDLNLGWAAKTRIGGGSSPRTESHFSFVANMGYLFLAGYRVPRWAALGGIDFRWRAARIGDVTTPDVDGPLFNFSRPLVLRGEYCISREVAEKRAIVMFWYAKSTATQPNYLSVRAEYPLGSKGRYWLCFQYTYQKSISEDTLIWTPPVETKFNQYMIGIRIQNALL